MMAGTYDGEDDPTSHYRHHHCNFPVSRAPKDQKSLRYLRIPVFLDNDESQDKGQRARESQILLSAWAVMLHKYTGSELVSFAVFYGPDLPNGCKHSERVVGEEDPPGAENVSDKCNDFILRYQVSEDARLLDVCQVSREPWTAADGARGGSVNTAVDFSGRSDFGSCGQQDDEEEKQKLSSVQLKTGHRKISDYVGSLPLLYLSTVTVYLIKKIVFFKSQRFQLASSPFHE